ncbi:MAG: PilZ domain-containing protein [Gammaproteobacteria bacterium]|nr:PilZ domain-containing protein [Gammaproteobacteria bacterium]
MSTTEKRRFSRVREKAPVTVRIQSAPGNPILEGREFKCSSRDLSEGGLRLNVDVPAMPNSLLELQINLGGAYSKYRFIGTVVWTQKAPPKGAAGKRKSWPIGVDLQLTNNPMTESWNQALKKLRE